MKKLLNFVKTNYLGILVLFLFIFIPLYPKLPLIDIKHTWVYIRLEDFVIVFIIGIFIFDLWKSKKTPNSPLTVPIVVYWIIGVISLVNSIFILRRVIPHFFPHLAALHYIRRLEYMSLFFISYEACKRNKDKFVSYVTSVLVSVVIVICIYGIGQKFLGFPAFSTMNEEFAKGAPLILPPTARITSTFAGHYDLAAYLVLLIPVFGSLIFGVRRTWQKIIFLLVAFFAYVVLLYTKSRISFGAYLITISMMLLWQKKKLLILPVIIVSLLLMNIISGASDRFSRTIRFSDVIIDLSTGQPIGVLDKLEAEKQIAVLEKPESPAEEELPKGTGYISVPASKPTPQGLQKIIKTIEIYSSKDLVSGFGEIATISGSFLIQKALIYDISITTRFQGQWPRAIEALKRNIFFGSGYSVLSLAADSDYLRMLGETGILGTFSFLGIFAFALSLFIKRKDKLTPLSKAFVIGVFAGFFGLFFNATFIDVFEASKVAYSLWLLLGVVLALLISVKQKSESYWSFLKSLATHRITLGIYIGIFILILFKSAYALYFTGDDFTWLRWAASSTLEDIPKYLLSSKGFFYRPIPKLWYFFLYSVFWLKPAFYHVMSVILFLIVTVSVYTLMLRFKIRPYFACLWASLFAVLSIHHENIYWVSGHSSLIAGVFMFLSIIFFDVYWTHKRLIHNFSLIPAIIFLFAAMVSYDGLIVAPLIIWILGWFLYKKRDFSLFIALILIPTYWIIRNYSDALVPSGDYSYSLPSLIVNIFGNGLGYMLSIPFGPFIIEKATEIREFVRGYKTILTLLTIISVSFFIRFGLKKVKEIIRNHYHSFIWLVCAAVALLPYLGLGGMAERYALISSGFFIIACSLVTDAYLKRTKYISTKILILVTVFLLIVLNIHELKRIEKDWQKANEISKTALLKIKEVYFPLTAERYFIFVNVPIKIGRAWVFNIGLKDALWHIFRFGQYGYDTAQVSTSKDAFEFSVPRGTPEPLIFEDYILKKAVKQIERIEIETSPNSQ